MQTATELVGSAVLTVVVVLGIDRSIKMMTDSYKFIAHNSIPLVIEPLEQHLKHHPRDGNLHCVGCCKPFPGNGKQTQTQRTYCNSCATCRSHI